MKDKVEFVHYSDVFGFPHRVLEATTWEEAADELYSEGNDAQLGECKIVKRTYKWISDEPQIIDTDY
jgi:hypothetical protein